ncbi:hypothetical protein BCR34DRAFT_585380 [Clohesyomyces aquaticus]|uniref:Uncharacterized protein n=1 Tax=Clohesyomyces aquaticus TaxID=1231657 RepID=A0A1Y1ZXQ7_9PLEO|nr:hypothetical protein BCR34DRAFT_585380 [Clohesyomyces aquaticus]
MSSSSTSNLPGSQPPEYIPLQQLEPDSPIRVRKRKREARQPEQALSSTENYDDCDYPIYDHPIEDQPLSCKSSTFSALLHFKFPERKRHKSGRTGEMPGPETSSHPDASAKSSRYRVVTDSDDRMRHDSASAGQEEKRRRSTFGSFVSGVKKSFSAVSRRRKVSSRHEHPPVPLLPVRPHTAAVHRQPHVSRLDHHGAVPSNDNSAGSSTSWPSASILSLDLATQYMGRTSTGVPSGHFDGTHPSPSRSPSPEPDVTRTSTPRTNVDAGVESQQWNRSRGWNSRGVPSTRPSGNNTTRTPSKSRLSPSRRTTNFLFLSRSPRAQVQPSTRPGLTYPFSRTPRNRNAPSQRSPISPFKNGPLSPFRNPFRRETRAPPTQPSPARSEAFSISDPNLFGPMPNFDFQFSFTPKFGNPRELERRHSVSSPHKIGILPDADTDSLPNLQTRSAGDIPHAVFSETPSPADNGTVNPSITTNSPNTETSPPDASEATPSRSTTPPGFPQNSSCTPIPGLQIPRLCRPPPRPVFDPPPPHIHPPTFIETLSEAVADAVPQPNPPQTPAADPEPEAPFYTPPTRPSGPIPRGISRTRNRDRDQTQNRDGDGDGDGDADAETNPFIIPGSPFRQHTRHQHRHRHYPSRTRVSHLDTHGDTTYPHTHSHMNWGLGLDFDRVSVLSPSTRRPRANLDSLIAAAPQLQTHGLLDDEDDVEMELGMDRGVGGDMSKLVDALDEVIEEGGRIRSSWDMDMGGDADTNTRGIGLVDGDGDEDMVELELQSGGGGSSQEGGEGSGVDVSAVVAEDEDMEADDEHETGLDGEDDGEDEEDEMLWGGARGRTVMRRYSLEGLRRMLE